MKYTPAVALTLIAALVAAIGGALQGATGPGTQPGVTLTHFAAGMGVLALFAAVIAGLARDDETAPAAHVYVTATDGEAIIPVVGPYASEVAAYADLPDIRAQFDPHGRYEWMVQTADTDTAVTGVANDHFKLV